MQLNPEKNFSFVEQASCLLNLEGQDADPSNSQFGLGVPAEGGRSQTKPGFSAPARGGKPRFYFKMRIAGQKKRG